MRTKHSLSGALLGPIVAPMEQVLDLQQYPLDRLDSDVGRALVDDCKTRLDQDGMFTLSADYDAQFKSDFVGQSIRGELKLHF